MAIKERFFTILGKNHGYPFIFLISIFLSIFAFISWFVLSEIILSTSDVAFCGQCHSMKPIAASYFQDVHGGKNSSGFKVECTKCHLPHNNQINFFVQKTITGFYDFWVEHVTGADHVNWLAKRDRRGDFVYDSGCLKCHSNLQESTQSDPNAFVAHKPYFLNRTSVKCVFCHPHVGHKDLVFSITKFYGAK